ncbi:MAG: DUF5615 family PIN-like protein [Streptosporangiaceae bacterium]
MRILLDEMYSNKLAQALRHGGVDAATVAELGLAGRSDVDVFAAAVDQGYAVLTDNVSDFALISGEHIAAGRHHFGVLIALSSRFSRRPTGYGALVTAVTAMASYQLNDRLVYLERLSQR